MARRRSEPDGSRALLPDERLWELEDRYRGSFGPPSISYGTVRDLADSAVTIPGLAGANHDMKDLQRCWMLKAVLGSVTSGGRILEIGAGEPLVAGILSRMGFAVTVVDPYDGSGNGPREFEQFSLAYPGLEIVRDSFPPASDLGAGFSAVYSVSVLEHIDATELGALMEGIAEHLDPLSGRSIHAIDHVVAGFSADSHRERLEVIAGACGIPPPALAETVSDLERDPDTYWVSAEAHERWRGDLPYEQYPMRRIASIQLATGPPRSAAPPA